MSGLSNYMDKVTRIYNALNHSHTVKIERSSYDNVLKVYLYEHKRTQVLVQRAKPCIHIKIIEYTYM